MRQPSFSELEKFAIELKNSIWVKIGKSLGDLGEADRIFR